MAGPTAAQVDPTSANETKGAPANVAANANESLSADEIALYDRQIRLWGAQAQERIRSASILLVSLRALGTEIAKNLTLAGINSLTIIDDEPVTEEDLGAQYFLREEDVGKPRAQCAIPRIQELNPRVKVKSGGSLQDLLTKDQNYYTPFDCVIACDHDFMTLCTINTAARFANRPFYAAAMHGFYGYIFADLVGHEFVVERDKSNIATKVGSETTTRSVISVSSKRENNGKTVEVVKKQEIYCPFILANTSKLPPDVLGNRRKLRSVPALLPCLRAIFDFQRTYGRLPGNNSDDIREFTTTATTKSSELQLPQETLRAEFLRSFMQNIGAEIVPTAAFVGGRLSEDVINVLGKREQPIQNFALFDGDAMEGRIYSLYSPPPEVALAADLSGMAGMTNGLGDMSNGGASLGNGSGAGTSNGVANGMDMSVGAQYMPTNTSIDFANGGFAPGIDMGNPSGLDTSQQPAYVPTNPQYTPTNLQYTPTLPTSRDGPVAPGSNYSPINADTSNGTQGVPAGLNNAGPTSAPANQLHGRTVEGGPVTGS